MKVLVFIKQIPDISDVKYDHETKRIIRTNVKLMINSFDKKAVEAAIQLKEKYGMETYVASMGPPSAEDIITDSLKMGIDHGILITDKQFAGADTYITARILSHVVKLMGPDIVLTGKYSLDGETSQVPPEISYFSNYNFISSVSNIEINGAKLLLERDEDYGIRKIMADLPAVISVSEKINRARPVPDIEINNDIKIIDSKKITINGRDSLTVVKNTSMLNSSRNCKFIDFKDLLQILDENKGIHVIDKYKNLDDYGNDSIFLGLAIDEPITSMEIASKIAEISNMKIVIIGNINPEKIDGIACHEYIYLKNPDIFYFSKYVSEYIKSNDVKHVLAPSNLNGRDIASLVAASLNLGLTADCIDISLVDNKMIQYKPAFGGGIIAEIISKTTPDIATARQGMFRIKFKNYNARVIMEKIENERNRTLGYEESKFPALNTRIIMGAGRGVKREYIEKLREISGMMHASLGGTRKIVDMHFMPRQVQIGLTGISISPDIYINIGASGADNHIVGIRYAKKIISINNDRNANIFKYSDYGIIMDSSDFIDRLFDYVKSNHS